MNTLYKNLIVDGVVDPRRSIFKKRVFEGYQNIKIIKKLDKREGFDTRKIKHIDLVEYDRVGFWGRKWY